MVTTFGAMFRIPIRVSVRARPKIEVKKKRIKAMKIKGEPCKEGRLKSSHGKFPIAF